MSKKKKVLPAPAVVVEAVKALAVASDIEKAQIVAGHVRRGLAAMARRSRRLGRKP